MMSVGRPVGWIRVRRIQIERGERNNENRVWGMIENNFQSRNEKEKRGSKWGAKIILALACSSGNNRYLIISFLDALTYAHVFSMQTVPLAAFNVRIGTTQKVYEKRELARSSSCFVLAFFEGFKKSSFDLCYAKLALSFARVEV